MTANSNPQSRLTLRDVPHSFMTTLTNAARLCKMLSLFHSVMNCRGSLNKISHISFSPLLQYPTRARNLGEIWIHSCYSC